MYIFACAQAKLLKPNQMIPLQKKKEHPLFRLVSGRLVVRESVLWHKHALVTPGRRRVTAADNLPRTEVGWFYIDRQEVQLMPDDMLALRAAELAQRAQKRAASKRKRKKISTTLSSFSGNS